MTSGGTCDRESFRHPYSSLSEGAVAQRIAIDLYPGEHGLHLMRNVLTKVPQRLRARLARELSGIFKAPSKAEAQKQLKALEAGLGRQVPEAMECLEEGFAAATRFYAFPKEHWHRIRSTNGLERLNGEIKRRTRAVGAFPDRSSALRLITAVALQVTEIWATRRYLDMSLLNPKEDRKAA